MPSIDHGGFQENVATTPFLSHTALLADLGSLAGSLYYGKKASRLLNRARDRGVLRMGEADFSGVKYSKPVRSTPRMHQSAGQLRVRAGLLGREVLPGGVTIERAGGARPRGSIKDIRIGKRAAKLSRGLMRGSMLLSVGALFSIGAEIGVSLFDSATGYHEARRARSESITGMNSESGYFDSRAAFTQRQRALMVIHNSQLSTRAAFGAEAGYMHN